MGTYDDLVAKRRRNWVGGKPPEGKEAPRKPPVLQMKRLIVEAKLEDIEDGADRLREEPPPDDLLLHGPPLEVEARKREAERQRIAAEEAEKRRLESMSSRDRAMHYRKEHDREEWEYTKTWITRYGTIAAVIIAVLALSSYWIHATNAARVAKEIEDAMGRAKRGDYLMDLRSPVLALASYRSAWLRGDMRALWSLTSMDKQAGMLSYRSAEETIRLDQKRYDEGGSNFWVLLMKALEKPEFLRDPGSNWKEGDIAAFITPPFREQHAQTVPVRYVIAFVFESRQWKFYVATPESTWRPRWKTVKEVRPAFFKDKRGSTTE